MIEENEPDPLLWKDPAPEQVANWLLYALLKYWQSEQRKAEQPRKRRKKKVTPLRRKVAP